MDARRRAAARIGGVASRLLTVLQARTTARRIRTFNTEMVCASLTGLLADELEQILHKVADEGRVRDYELAIQDALKDLVPLADAISEVAVLCAAEGPVWGPPPSEPDKRQWAQGWSHQLETAQETAATLLKEVLPYCDSQQQRSLLAAAAAMMQAGAPACTAMLQQPRQTGTLADRQASDADVQSGDETVGKLLRLAAAALKACNVLASQPATAAVAAEALEQALSPDAVQLFWEQLTPAFDLVVNRRGMQECTFVVPLCRLLEAQLKGSSGHLLPHARALLGDWALLEGLAHLLSAAHSALVGVRFWEAGTSYPLIFWHSRKHSSLVDRWIGCWGRLQEQASHMGPEQEARVAALLAAAAGPMLREEVDLLASLPLEPPPRIGDEQEHVAATRARELERCRGTAVYAVGALACFLLPARSGTKAVAGVWRVLQRLASSAQHVAHGCHASKLMVPPAARRLASSLNTWLQGCQAAIAAAAAAAAARLDAAPEGQGQQQASAAATLATGLLRLTRQLPHLQRALNGCHGGADCRCKLCDGRDRLDVRMVRVDGLRVLTVAGQALELCGQVARGPDHTVHGTTTLARLHSACASVCHFLAQADRWTLTLCFGQPSTTSNGALLQRSEAAVAQDLLRALREAKHMLETAANHALEALHAIKPADQDSEAARQWDRVYVCAILETTSAQVALQAASDSLEAGAERGSARQRVVLELAALAGLEPSAQQDEAAVLGELAAALCDPTAAQLLPLLVRRLLPPEQAAGDGQAAAAAAGPLPTEAAVLHAEALATRRTCSYLYCPHLALAGTSKLCARCRRVRYDSTACQRADWREHHKPGCIRT